MTNTAEIYRIQAYLREAARRQYQSLALPPFTLFFHPIDSLKYFNYAIPDEPCAGDLSRVLAQLREEFNQRGRAARFEFYEAFAPDLPAILRQNGFVEEDRQWSMLCTPATLRSAPPVPGLEVVPVGPASPEQDITDFILTQRQGFDPEDQSQPTEQNIKETRQRVEQSQFHAFLGRMNGEPAGVSAFGHPINGVAEIAGIATRSAYRRRGIATLLTEYAARRAFEVGAQTLCLTAADENAGRVYGQVGFQPFSIMLAYIEHGAA